MDIRIFSKLAAAVAMLLTIVSCNKTEMANTGAAVGYSVGIAGADGSKATAGTKAVLFNSATDIQQNGNSFACSAYNETQKTSLYTGETVTYNGTKWDTTNPYNWQPGETLTFHAVYPASAAGSADGTAVIAADGTGISIANFTVADDAKDQNDILFGKYSGAGETTGKPDGTAVISFLHPFTAVRFVMGDIADYVPGFTGISSITISDVHSSGTLAKWNGGAFSWAPSGAGKTVTLNVGGANPARTEAIKGTDANAEAFTLIPQTLSTNPATITINYNATVNGSIVATVSKVSETGTAWEAGNVYTYTVNYKTLPVTINDSVEPWIPDAEKIIDTDNEYVMIPAKYDGTNVTYLKWYRQNLAITASGNKKWKGGSASAVKVPGSNEDVIAGDYFQWAAYEGYAYVEGQTVNDNGLLVYTAFNNTQCVGDTGSIGLTVKSGKQFNMANAPYGGTTYTKYTSGAVNLESSDDVANLVLGGSWHIPTSAEFKAMLNATYWSWDATDKGYYVYTPDPATDAGKVNGGGTGTYNKSDALLFFPAVGNGTNASLGVGSGYYWTGTLYPTDESKAWNFNFNGSGIYQGGSYRYLGHSIRPVSE